jgi:archaellum component FlaC
VKHRSDPTYIDRTIATVRNHRDADNMWPQWANIFADEIEDLREDLKALKTLYREMGNDAATLMDQHVSEEVKQEAKHRIIERWTANREILDPDA